MNRERWLQLLVVLYAAAVIMALVNIFPHGKTRSASKKGGALAVVRIYGALHTSMSASPWEGPDADDIAERLHKLSEDDDVKAILLRINSPGGTVGAVQEIDTEIQRCRSKGKKIVASLGDVAASGGYYLAASADHVVSNPGTITGSIGVILEFGNLEGLMQKLGVRLEVIKSGAHKDIGSPARPLTAEERALLQASINDAYDQFVQAVAQGRHRSLDDIRPLADGRIFTGRQALQAGLVDQMGNEQDAIQKAIELAHLPAHPRIIYEDQRSLSGLVRHLSGESAAHSWQTASEMLNSPSVEYRWR
jgi:protease IV